jgi:hypothetical protein
MSNFLGFESYLIPLGASIAATHNTIRDALSTRGWQILKDDSGATPTVLDVIPPVTETIGDANTQEFLRINVYASSITFTGLKKWLTAIPQQVYIKELTGGAVTCSCTLDGVTVSYTGSTGNTAVQNLMGLYGAIRDSTLAPFTGWEWEVSYPAPQNGDDTATYIFGLARVAAPDVAFTGVNVTAGILGNYVAPGYSTSAGSTQASPGVTIDLVNGFVYYFQINARGIALATKTNDGFYGPIHACWGDHAAAIAYMPVDSKFLSPIELIVGTDNASTAMDAVGYVNTFWVICAYTGALLDPTANFVTAAPGGSLRRNRITEAQANTYSLNNYIGAVGLKGSGIFEGDFSKSGNDYQVHRVKTLWLNVVEAGDMGLAPGQHSVIIRPGFEISDWYKFRGTATNESLLLIADTVGVTPLASNYTPGDATLVLTDASGFQTSGFAIINNEALQYTGKTGNTLTGITGGQYATPANRHYVGDTVCQGMWFAVINGGALFAGYNKPV